MKIDLTVPPGDSWTIAVNGSVVGEGFSDTMKTRDDLLNEVSQARALSAFPNITRSVITELRKARDRTDHNFRGNPGRHHDAQDAAIFRGLLDGFEERTAPHPDPGVPPTPPEHTPSYRAGYEAGRALTRVARVSEQGR